MHNTAASNSWLNSPILRRGVYPTPKMRLLIHLGIWFSVAGFTTYTHHWLLKGIGWRVYIPIVLVDSFTILSSYYFLAVVGLPRLYRNQWFQFSLCLLGVYVFNTITNFLLYTTVANTYQVLQTIADAFGKGGLWKSLFHRDTFLISWSFTLSTLTVPLVAKVVKDILLIQSKATELERDNLKLELKFLQSQIQPHFVLNSLNSVYSLIACIDDEAGAMLLRLSDLLRYALHETAHPTVSLTREVEFLREYITLEAVRQHERTTLSFNHDGPLDGYHIPPLLLVTFVENAFKHGINATYRQAWAIIRLKINDDGLLQFHVENSLPPPDARRNLPPAASGVGIENTRRRLNILFPDRHQLLIGKDAETFTVDLTIQLKLERDGSTASPLTHPTNPPQYGTTRVHLFNR